MASDAPIWMHYLSRLASSKNIPLNKEFFTKFVVDQVNLYPGVVDFLRATRDLEKAARFRKMGINIHHFIVSAGLKELIEECFPKNLITWTFGCRYTVTYEESKEMPISVPVFCMDETMKTRSIFEIAKGTFNDQQKGVNTRVAPEKMWCPFPNMIYIGDGPTDVPALSLVRDRGGLGVAVYDKAKSAADVKKRLRQMSLDRRTDLITKADYSLQGELYKFIQTRCIQILQRYEAGEIDYLDL